MKTLRSLLDALAFANVSNLGEFRAMLRHVERPDDDPVSKPHSDDAPPAPSCVAVRPIPQGAL